MTLSTFGGGAIPTVAAKAVLDFIEEERLGANVEQMGAYIREKLLALQDRFPVIGDVRGMGLMQALELVEDRASKTPAPALANRILEAARDNRLLIGKGGLHSNVVRVTPPLNITRSDVDQFAAALEKSFAMVCEPALAR